MALAAASACAPNHPKLSAPDVRVRRGDLSSRSDPELVEEVRALEAKMRAVGLTIDAKPEPVEQSH